MHMIIYYKNIKNYYDTSRNMAIKKYHILFWTLLAHNFYFVLFRVWNSRETVYAPPLNPHALIGICQSRRGGGH